MVKIHWGNIGSLSQMDEVTNALKNSQRSLWIFSPALANWNGVELTGIELAKG